MRLFSHGEFDKLSSWTALETGFGRDRSALIGGIIQPLIEDLNSKGWACTVGDDGGLSNYYSFRVSTRASDEQIRTTAYFSVDGVAIYLSLLGPYACLGRIRTDYFSQRAWFESS